MNDKLKPCPKCGMPSNIYDEVVSGLIDAVQRVEAERDALRAELEQVQAERDWLASKLRFHNSLPCDDEGDCYMADPDACTNGKDGNCWLLLGGYEAAKCKAGEEEGE